MPSQKFLKFGLIVRLENQNQGFLFGKGFFDVNLSYQINENPESHPSFRDGLFQIQPAGNFEAHTQYLNYLFSVAEEGKQSIYQKMIEVEKEEFKNKIINDYGKLVTFGSQITLKHINSNSYLSGSKECSEGRKGSFVPKLSDVLSKEIIFTIKPFGSYMYDGDYIPLQTICGIYHVSTSSYLAVEEHQIPSKYCKHQSKIGGVIIPRRETLWHFVPHDKMEKNIDFIGKHQLVFFIHTKNDGHLLIDNDKLYLKDIGPTDIKRTTYYNGIWIVIPVQDRDDQTGEKLYTLKNINKDIFITKHSIRIVGSSTNLMYSSKPIHIILKHTKGQLRLKSNDNIYIKWEQKYLDLKSDDSNLTAQQVTVDHQNYIYARKRAENCFRIIKLDQETMLDVNFTLVVRYTLEKFLAKLHYDQEHQDYDYKESMEMVQKTLNSKDSKQLTSTLQKAKQFIWGLSLSRSMPSHKMEPKIERQCMFFDLEIHEKLMMLVKLIYNLRKMGIFSLRKLDRENLEEVARMCYQVLYVSFIGIDKYKMKDYIPTVYEHCVMPIKESTQNILMFSSEPGKPQKSADKFLFLLVESHRIREELDVAKYCERNTTRNFQFLSILCKKNEEPLHNNQNQIFKRIFMQPRYDMRMKIYQEEKSNEIYFEFKSMKIRYGQEANQSDYEYIYGWLNLLAICCHGRNTTNIEFINKSIFQNCRNPIFTLIKLLKNQKTQINNVFYPMIQLTLYVFIQKNYDKKLVMFTDLCRKDDLELKLAKNYQNYLKYDPCQELFSFIEKQIEKIKILPQNPNDKQLKNFSAYLGTLQTALKLGIWSFSSNKAIDNMMNLLKKSTKTQINKQESKQQFESRSIWSNSKEIIKVKLSIISILSVALQINKQKRVYYMASLLYQKIKEPENNKIIYSDSTSSIIIDIIDQSINKLGFGEEYQNTVLKIFETAEENIQVLSATLDILRIVVDQRNLLFQRFRQMYILDENEEENSPDIRFVERYCKQLSKLLAKTSLLTDEKEAQQIIMAKSNDPNVAIGLIQKIDRLCNWVKLSEQQGYLRTFDRKKLFVFFNQRQISISDRQEVLMAMKMDIICVQFIKRCQQPRNQLQKKLVCHIYYLLTNIVWNNPICSSRITKFRHILMNDLHYNVGCLECLEEIFENNSLLLFDRASLEAIIEQSMKELVNPNLPFILSIKILEFISHLVKCNQKIISENQIFILNKLQQYGIIFKYREEYVANYKRIVDVYQEQLNKDNKIIFIDRVVLWYTALYDLASDLVDGLNSINIQKCKQIFHYKGLLKQLNMSKRCWPLKKSIRTLLNKLYYIQSEHRQYMQLIKLQQFYYLIDDLSNYIDLAIKKRQKFNQVKLSDPYRYQYLASYLFLYINQVLISLDYILQQKSYLIPYIKGELKKYFMDSNPFYHYKLMMIAEKLTVIYNNFFFSNQALGNRILSILVNIYDLLVFNYADNQQFDGNLTELQIPHLSIIYKSLTTKEMTSREVFKQTLLSMDIYDKISHIMPVFFELKECSMQEQVRKQQRKNRYQFQNSSTMLSHKLKNKIGEPFKQITKEHMQNWFKQSRKNILKKNLTKSRIQIFLQHQQNKNQKYKHYPSPFRAICNILKTSKISFPFTWQLQDNLKQKQQLNSQQFLNSLKVINPYQTIIKVIAKQPLQFSENIKIFIIDVLCSVLKFESQSKTNQYGIEFWAPYQKEEEDDNQLVKRQIYLLNCQCDQLICSIIKSLGENDLLLSSRILNFGRLFLKDGNTRCQDAIIDILIKDKRNKFMVKLNMLINLVGTKVYNQYVYKQREVIDKKLNQRNTFDFFDITNNIMVKKNVVDQETEKEIMERMLAKEVLINAFQFLQQLCQNNNIRGKKFINEQTNKDGNSKRNSVNMINTAVNQLRRILINLNKQTIQIPFAILSFINEVTQIPCKENQIYLAKSKFCQQFRQLSHYADKHFDDIIPIQDHIYQLYRNCITIMLSIVEGNQDVIFIQSEKIEKEFFINIFSKGHITQKNRGMLMEIFILMTKFTERSDITKLGLDLKNHLDNLPHKNDNHTKQYLQKLSQSILCIQVEIEGQRQNVYFEKLDDFDQVSQETKQHLIAQPNQTRNTRLNHLLDRQYFVFNQIDYNSKQKSNYINSHNVQKIHTIAVYMSIFFTLLMAFDQSQYKDGMLIYKWSWVSPKIFKFFSLIQLVLQIVYFFASTRIRYPILAANQYSRRAMLKQPLQPVPKSNIKFYIWIIKILWNDRTTQYRAIFVVLSILGFYNPAYYSLFVFEPFATHPSLSTVFQAVILNSTQLIVLMIFGVVFFYAFARMGFQNYAKSMYENQPINDMCMSFFQCMLDLLVMGQVGVNTDALNTQRLLFDRIYFIFFGLLFGNIISGLMTDTFKELRNNRDQMRSFLKNTCQICGIDRQTVQKRGEVFSGQQKCHTSNHNSLNYLLYIYVLRNKKQTEYTGIQYKISNMLRQNDINWIPSYDKDESVKDPKQQTLIEKEQKLARKFRQILQEISQPLNIQ